MGTGSTVRVINSMHLIDHNQPLNLHPANGAYLQATLNGNLISANPYFDPSIIQTARPHTAPDAPAGPSMQRADVFRCRVPRPRTIYSSARRAHARACAFA
eukprot:IDg20497t1